MNDILRKYQDMLIDFTLNNNTICLNEDHKSSYFDLYTIKSYSEDIYKNLTSFLFSDRECLEIIEDPLCWQSNRISNIRDSVYKEKESKISNFIPNINFSDKGEYTEFLNEFYRGNINKNLDILSKEYDSLHNIIGILERIIKLDELYIGYPFIEGCIDGKNFLRMPIFLIPVHILKKGNSIFLYKNKSRNIIVNSYLSVVLDKLLMIKNLDFISEYDFSNFNRETVYGIVDYLVGLGLKFKDKGNLKDDFDKFLCDDLSDNSLKIQNYMILGKFKIIDEEYSDYDSMIHSDTSNTIVDKMFLSSENTKLDRDIHNVYVKDRVDYSEKKVLSFSDQNDITIVDMGAYPDKNKVISNILLDKIAKGNKVLLLSRNRDFIKEIYNGFNEVKDIMLLFPSKDLYKTIKKALENVDISFIDNKKIDTMNKILFDISNTYKLIEDSNSIYNNIESFGLSLQEMYQMTMGILDRNIDNAFMDKFITHNPVSGCSFNEIVGAIDKIRNEDLIGIFISNMEYLIRFKIVYTLKEEFSVSERDKYINSINSLRKKYGKITIPIEENEISKKICDLIKDGKPKGEILNDVKRCIDPNSAFTFLKGLGIFKNKKGDKPEYNISDSYKKIQEFIKDIDFLRNILKPEVFSNIVDMALSFYDLTDYIDKLYDMICGLKDFLDNYLKLHNLGMIVKDILDFIYDNSISEEMMRDNLNKVLEFSIFNNIMRRHNRYGEELFKYKNINSYFEKLYGLFDSRELKIEEFIYNLCIKRSKEYILGNNKDSAIKESISYDKLDFKIFLSKFYKECISLFPCFLSDYETISSILPMVSNMFDYVIFEDGEEYSVEEVLTYAYRGKKLIVFGKPDNIKYKSKVYELMNSDNTEISHNLFSFLKEKHSFLTLKYMYPKRNEILRDVSSALFKDQNFLYLPVNRRYKEIINPFTIFNLNGDREKFIDVIFKILREKGRNESVAIVALNEEFKEYISKAIENKLKSDEEFNFLYYKECKKYGKEKGIYISSFGDLQYEDRDIMILYLGYGEDLIYNIKNEFSRLDYIECRNKLNIMTKMGKKSVKVILPYSMDNILSTNYVDENVRIFMRYLSYAIDINNKNYDSLFNEVYRGNISSSKVIDKIYKKLIDKGINAEKNFGNKSYTFDLALYDDKTNRYVLFVEFEGSLINKFKDDMERYVDSFVYFNMHNYNVLKIWSKDIWSNLDKEVSNIIYHYNLAKSECFNRENVLNKFTNLLRERINFLSR